MILFVGKVACRQFGVFKISITIDYMKWAQRRQLMYLMLSLGAVAGLLFLVIYPRLNKEPTCSDNKKNGTELGVDCGGACSRLCPFEALDPIVRFARAYQVSAGVYNVLASVENKNAAAGIKKIDYIFRLYDEDSILVATKSGSTFITPNGITPIFESGIRAGTRAPKRTTFEFTEIPIWTRVNPSLINLPVTTKAGELKMLTVGAGLSGQVTNNSSYILGPTDVVALLSDDAGNVIEASKTVVSKLDRGETKGVYFTWPSVSAATSNKIDLLPRIDIFNIRP